MCGGAGEGTSRIQGPKPKKEALLKFGQDKAKGKRLAVEDLGNIKLHMFKAHKLISFNTLYTYVKLSPLSR